MPSVPWQEIKEVLLRALQLPAEERRAFLDRACTSDTIRRELESLLSSSEALPSSFLQSPTLDAVLTPGTKIGDYQVVAFIGAGGMGKVYRAHDSRLQRDVAIKILPPFLKNNPDRLRRFEQEARAAAALNHPNILAIHQLGTYEDAPYLVSELLEGAILREHMSRGPLSSRKAIEYGAQIAHGLAAAHEKGIVHRDLKPENLFVVKDGRIKILDFGLAKLTYPRQGPELVVVTSNRETEPGLVMGTVGYMSPEQVRGERTDHRADIFAFGAILYEMLSGRRAFQKPTVADTISAILNEEPPTISQIVPITPPPLQRMVARCIKKDPDQRFQSASDLAFALEALSGTTDSEADAQSGPELTEGKRVKSHSQTPVASSSTTAINTAVASPRKWRVVVAAAAVFLVASLAEWFAWHRTSQPKMPAALVAEQPLTTNPSENAISGAAISQDGKYLAYSDTTGTYLRLLSTGEVHSVLPDAKSAEHFAWFPDGTHLLASWPTSARKLGLWVFSIWGGGARQVSEEGWSAAVSPNGSQIVFLKSPVFWDSGAEIWVMDSSGGNERRIISPQERFALSSPVWSPDGRRIAYEKFRFNLDSVEASVEVFNLDHDKTNVVFSDPLLDSGLSWLPDGHLIYARAESAARTKSNLWIVGIDNRTSQVAETARRITNGDGYADQPSVTAEGRRLVFSRSKPQADVYIAQFFPRMPRIGTLRRLTLDDADDSAFDWTPDNRAVVFVSNRTGTDHIFVQGIDQTSAEMLVFGPGTKTVPRLSPDGSEVIYVLRSVRRSSPGRRLQDSPNDPTTRLMGVPIRGGPPRTILQLPYISNAQCSRAPANICFLSRLEQRTLILSRFDYTTGAPTQFATFAPGALGAHWNWSLSPDGKSLALVKFSADVNDSRIHLLSVLTGSSRDITVRGWNNLNSVDWAADSKGLFVSSEPPGGRSTLLYVDLTGNVHRLSEAKGHVYAIASRDNKYLAISALTLQNNVWMVENF